MHTLLFSIAHIMDFTTPVSTNRTMITQLRLEIGGKNRSHLLKLLLQYHDPNAIHEAAVALAFEEMHTLYASG